MEKACIVQVLAPEPRHAQGLVRLSTAFAQEHPWGGTIPIGRIRSVGEARQKLWGRSVIAALVAETPAGQMAGYVGVYRHPEKENASLSILVGGPYCCSGVGRLLIEKVFERLPPGLTVEAWVGAFNAVSTAAMPRLGFRLERVITHARRQVQVFSVG